jgi:UDP-glucuronate 4-epimerase
MRALVTGCAGFIGSHLTESLLADGHDVLGVDCFNNNYGRAQKLLHLEQARDWDGFVFLPLDLSRGDLDDVAAEVDVIFHLAGEPGVRTSWGTGFERYVRNNISATQQLLEAVKRQGGCRLVYASSSSVYGQAEMLPTSELATPAPFSPYGVTKLSGEHLCLLYAHNYGIEATALRYFSVYGPRQRPDMAFRKFCAAILEDQPLTVFGDGNQSRDFTYVADIVAATRAAAVSDLAVGEVMNVGGGSRATLLSAIEILIELSGRRPEIRAETAQTGDVRDTGADIGKARALIGFEPKTNLRYGLEEQWQWALADRRHDLGLA